MLHRCNPGCSQHTVGGTRAVLNTRWEVPGSMVGMYAGSMVGMYAGSMVGERYPGTMVGERYPVPW